MTYQNAAAIVADPATAVVEREPLTRAFDIIANAIERRNMVPVLSNARLMGDGAALFVTGTDLDLEITVAVPAAADQRFSLTLPAHKMRELLKKATASDFVAFTMPDLEHKPATAHCEEHDEFTDPATVDFERVKYRLKAIPTSDFPDLRGPDSRLDCYRAFTLTGAAFWSALDSTMAAISTEETRYYLNGIYLDRHYDGSLRFVATDGHRLYLQDMAAPEGCDGMPGIIIPRKTVALLHKLLKGKACPDQVSIEVTETKIRVAWGDVTVTSKLVDGTFPDYQRVIPTGNDKPADFDPAYMLEAIRAVSLISSERGRAVKYSFSRDECRLDVSNPDEGSASSSLVCGYESDPMEIGFNAAYMADALATAATVDGEMVTITMADSGSPAVVTGSREGWLAVLMPMRV